MVGFGTLISFFAYLAGQIDQSSRMIAATVCFVSEADYLIGLFRS